MKKIAGLLAACLFTAAAWAEPASEASIRQLLEVTQSRKLVDTMAASIDQTVQQSLRALTQARPVTAQQQRMLDIAAGRMAAAMREEIVWEKLEPAYVQIYHDTFTQEEVDGLTAFYRTPTGLAFIEKMPLVAQKSMALSQNLMAPVLRRMTSIMEDAAREARLPAPAQPAR